jgi:hypothetical protein
MPPRKLLTSQERAFCEGVVRHGNKTKAATDAGYERPNKVASRLMQVPRIADEVARLQLVIGAGRDAVVVAGVLEIRKRLTEHLNSVDPLVSMKAAELLLRSYGAFERAPAQAAKDGERRDYGNMSQAELDTQRKVIGLRLLGSGDGS